MHIFDLRETSFFIPPFKSFIKCSGCFITILKLNLIFSVHSNRTATSYNSILLTKMPKEVLNNT